MARHGMSAAIDPAEYAELMRQDMERGLKGEKSSMPMIPTYIKNDGLIPKGVPAAVIDAGGTNFRSGLVTFTDEGYELSDVTKHKMPGTDKSATWEEFISFAADSIMPLMDKTDLIGFCFSYNADITPEIDGLVKRIDKEVVITGSSGKLVGASLTAELARRGVTGKRVFILNDTVAALLGSSCTLDKSAYSGFIGQISGTGTNTCCALPYRRITKLGRDEDGSILVNLESGLYDGMPQGDFDVILDRESHNPGEKIMEKLTAGVYLGELGRLMLRAAADEGLLSAGSAEHVRALGRIDASVIDAWASGEQLDLAADNADDADFAQTMSLELFRRSAQCMCANLAGIMLLTGAGDDAARPVCVCAEGSLVDRSRHFRPMLEELLNEYAAGRLGKHAVLRVSRETTLPGSAAAALLNR
mgnify:FL=1